MCFFDMTLFVCGDWRWGSFRRQCDQEHRIGRTCGLKLVETTIQAADKCSICKQIDVKHRRRERLEQRVALWRGEGSNPASEEKAVEEMASIAQEIERLQARRPSAMNQL